MSWSGSAFFRPAAVDMITGRSLLVTTHTHKLTLWDNTVTPDKDASAANTVYLSGTWLTAREVYQAGQWAQGGVALSGLAVTTPGSGIVQCTATNPTSGTNCTISGACGAHIRDTQSTPTADLGLSFHNFNASTGVTNGTYTAVISVNGIFRATV